MKDPIVIVGSGASGVHFAQTALEKGRRVLMLDIGYERPEPVLPNAGLNDLKDLLPDPVDYFLGKDFEALTLPGGDGEFYGFPPSKNYVFRDAGALTHRSSGFAPLFSFATGGLAEAWTGGSYPFTDDDLQDYPFSHADIAPHYGRVAERIGVSGVEDDLARFFPPHTGLLDPLELDTHSRALLDAYDRKRDGLNKRLRCYVGRARLATLTRDLAGRRACSYLGRCLWGCPTKSLYTPSLTLDSLRKQPDFEYVRGVNVTHFTPDDGGRIRSVTTQGVEDGRTRAFDVGTLVLAAGTLGSAKILLDSIYRSGGEVARLPGLIDNRQILMPFVNTKLVGTPWEPRSYQYHQLAIAIDADDPRRQIHGLVTTLKTAMIHPVVQNVPTSMRTALSFVRDIHGALGLLNINFADWRRDSSYVTLDVDGPGKSTALAIHYEPSDDEPARLATTIKTFRKVLRRLGCIAPKGMIHRRPMGASVHYAGTVPMGVEGAPFASDENGRCRSFENLYLADGSAFPSLPAKNLTFTLMANATRIAQNVL